MALDAEQRRRTVGAILARHRGRVGISQAELAQQAVVAQSLISMIERGHRDISRTTVLRLGSVLGGGFIREVIKEQYS